MASSSRVPSPSPSTRSNAPLLGRRGSVDTLGTMSGLHTPEVDPDADEREDLLAAAAAAGLSMPNRPGASSVREAEEGAGNAEPFTFKRKGPSRRNSTFIRNGSILGGLAASWRSSKSSLMGSIAPASLRSPTAGVYYGPSAADKVDSYDPKSAEWAMEGTGRRVAYDDFTTIDWIHDFSKERVRIRKMRQHTGIRGNIRKAFDACQAWILVFLVGAVTGLLAAYIDLVSEWAGDIREGHCKEGFYLNRKFCCWHVDGDDVCDTWAAWGGGGDGAAHWATEYFSYMLFGTGLAVTSAVLVKVYAPYAAGSGIPEIKTILGGFVIRKFLGGWTLLVKCIGICLSVGSGLSLGKEGPFVHIACCVGNILPRIFDKYAKNEAKKREILSAASAAGVSVAFGAPIGGVLFSLEEVSSYFSYKTMWRSFFCAMVAAISLQLVNPFRTGKLVLFAVEYKRPWHGFELPFFVLLGILGGLFGAFFIRMNIRVAEYRKNTRLRDWPVTEVSVITFITVLLSFLHPLLRVGSVDLVANLFRECVEHDSSFYGLCEEPLKNVPSVIFYLILAAGLKILFTIFTFGIKVPAGIFIPSMTIGACVGRALGIIMQTWQKEYPSFWLFNVCGEDCVTPGTYAMVGAAAALAGVTRMTVSLTVIMFELTGALTYILPIMLTVMVSKWVGDAFGTESIYDAHIHLNGYPFLDAKDEYVWNTTAGSVMTRVEDLEVIVGSGCTLESLQELLQGTAYKGYPVVDGADSMRLIGFAGRAELRYAMEQARKNELPPHTICTFAESASPSTARPYSTASYEENDISFVTATDSENPEFSGDHRGLNTEDMFLDLRPWTDQTPMTISPRFPMEMVMELFKKMGLRYVLVCKDGRLVGVITKKDLLRHVNVEKSRWH